MQKRILASAFAAGIAALVAFPIGAQVAPSAQQVAAYTGLLAAAHGGDVAQLKCLLLKKTDLEIRDAQQRTPLHVATYARRHDAIRLLAEAGAALNAMEHQRYDPVTIAAVANDDGTLALLLKLGASAKNVTSPYDGTALIAAAHLGHVSVVKQLIASGAPLNHVNSLHWTALIEAIVLGDGGRNHTEVVRLLLDAGADRTLTDSSGNTPLALAQARGYREMVQLLTSGMPVRTPR